jgi:hypothetical protein
MNSASRFGNVMSKLGVTGFIAKAPTISLVDDAMEEAWWHREQWREMGARAGEAIRRLLPEDPVGEFCEQWLAIAQSSVLQPNHGCLK